jgi:hypothetical protein
MRMSAKRSPQTEHSKAIESLPDNKVVGGLRKPHNFTLSDAVDETITRTAQKLGCSRSAAIEKAFFIDYADIFRRFKEGQSFVDIVIETRTDPQCIRLAKEEYDKGFEKMTLAESKMLDRRLDVEILRIEKQLEAKTEEIQSKERVEMSKLETKRDLAERKARLEADKAEARARIKRLESLAAPYTPVPRQSMFSR